jgi:hypothetical protein
MKSNVLWDVQPYSLVEVPRYFSEERTDLILSVEQYSNQPASSVFPASSLAGLLLDPEDGGSMFLRNIAKPYRTRASHPRILCSPLR